MAWTQRNDVCGRRRLLVAAVVAFAMMLMLVPSSSASAEGGRAPEDVGYVLERGRARTVAFPGAALTVVAGINDRGEIVGKYKDADGRDLGFLRNRQGRYVRLDVPGAGGTEPTKINNRGQIVGTYNPQGPLAGDPGSKGFLFDDGRFVTIHMPGAVYTLALGINEAGVVVGEYLDSDGTLHGYRWHRGRFTVIEVPGSTGTSVSDINDHGDLAGVHGDASGDIHGFVLRDRPHADFDSFDAPGARYTLAFGINNRRQVVGAGANDIVTGSDAQGFVLTGGVNGRFSPIEIRGTTRTLGFDINNRGQIVAGIVPAADGQQAGAAQPMEPAPGMPLTPDSRGDADQPSSQQSPPPRIESTARFSRV